MIVLTKGWQARCVAVRQTDRQTDRELLWMLCDAASLGECFPTFRRIVLPWSWLSRSAECWSNAIACLFKSSLHFYRGWARRDEVSPDWRKGHSEGFLSCSSHQTLSEWPNRDEQDRRDMWHVWWRCEMRIEFWWGNLNERELLEDLGIRDRIVWTLLLRKSFERPWIAFNWLGIRTSDWYFWEVKLWVPEVQGISGLNEERFAFHEGICFPWQHIVWLSWETVVI